VALLDVGNSQVSADPGVNNGCASDTNPFGFRDFGRKDDSFSTFNALCMAIGSPGSIGVRFGTGGSPTGDNLCPDAIFDTVNQEWTSVRAPSEASHISGITCAL
jgi:hypothetical protein